MSKIDLLLHPIRIRIIMALTGKPLTPGQIAADISDVAQTSLYRHINALVEGGILAVVDERPIRGTVEKVYALVEGGARLNADDIASVNDEDHLRYFMVFLSSLLQDFSSYLDKTQTKPDKDMVYSKARLYLTDEEYKTLTEQFRNTALPYTADQAQENRKRYIFGFVSIPEDE